VHILGSLLLNIPFLQELTIGFVVHVVLEVQCNYLTVELQTLEIELQLANIYSHNNPNPLSVQKLCLLNSKKESIAVAFFSIAYAIELCYNSKPESVHFDQHKMNEHLIECVNEEHLRPFKSIDTILRPTSCFRRINYIAHYIEGSV
jgi:hypothetical protein